MSTLFALVSILTLGGEPHVTVIRHFHTEHECEERLKLMNSRYPNPDLACIPAEEVDAQ